MNCQEYRTLIEDALDESIHGEPERRVRLHLEHCADCRAYFTARQAEHIALFAGVNAACAEMRLPGGFADRLAAAVRHRRAARRGWRRLLTPGRALLAASLAAMVAAAATTAAHFARRHPADAPAALPAALSTTPTDTTRPERNDTMNRTTAGLAALTLAAAPAPAATAADQPDAYIEYVEATGSQYIDTGVNAQTGLKARIDMAWADGGTSCDWGFLGAKDTSKDNLHSRVFLYHGNYNGGMFRVAYGYGEFGRPAYNPGYETRHEIVSDFTDNAAIQIAWNGTNTISAAEQERRAGYGPLDLGLNLYLFAINLSGAPANHGKGRLYELRLFRKDATTGELELLRHYLPCLKYGRAGLYDKVNGTISFSQGTADFVAGPTLAGPGEMVAWVESDGAKISIDTRVVGKIGLRSSVDATLLESTGDHALLAARGAGSSTNYRLYMAYHYNGSFCYGDGPLRQPKNMAPVAGTRYRIESDLSADAPSVTVNGTELNTGFTGTSYFSTGLNLHLFCNNHMGAGCKNYAKARLYAAKIWDGDELLRDFAPCVDTDGVAGLYDAVSERVFRPDVAFDLATQVGAVTNAAVAAGTRPDARLGYIESDGANDYIDLGVSARDGVELEAVMEWVTVPADGAFVGARTGSGDAAVRFFPYHYFKNADRSSHRAGYAGTLLGSSATTQIPAATAGTVYHVSSRLDAGDQWISVRHQEDGAWVWDSVANGRTAALPGPVDTGLPLYLFAVNYDGTPNWHGHARVHALKLRVKQADGTYKLARDLVPVRHDGLPMFWDKVSETFFRNNGRYLIAGGGTETPWKEGLCITVR